MSTDPILIVGGGHNGLVAACYLGSGRPSRGRAGGGGQGRAAARELSDPPPTYCFTPSVYDDSLAPPGRHTVYLARPGAHPMFLDISLDQLAFLRPTRRRSGHTVPGVGGLFTCGASTAPVGGIAGSSGKAAALKLLAGS